MTGTEVRGQLLDKIAAREQAVAAEAEQVRTHTDELAGRPGELDQEAEHLRITRKTVLALAHDDLHEPPTPVVPEHPAYQQILAAFAEMRQPMRARDPGQALDLDLDLDLDIIPKNTESTRHKLKRLVDRGILSEAEPGLFSPSRA
ncbi:hypothetical protein [Streptomyces sp. LN704]|uniref:hypothetical protein n=1 Tax=unclassified Streptomyces TaxID=2593676 RepID=UPI00371056E4